MSSRLDQEDEKSGPDAAAPAIVEKALFKSRTVLLTGEVNDVLARRVTERLLALALGAVAMQAGNFITGILDLSL